MVVISSDCITFPYFLENSCIYNALNRLDSFAFDEKSTFLTAIRVILRKDKQAIHSFCNARNAPFRIDSIMCAYKKKLYSAISLHRELQLYSKDMKKVKMQKLSSKEKENALNEVRILASINHPNDIGYKEAFFEETTNSLCIVMENADGGDLL